MSICTPVLIILVGFMTGGGHGYYEPMIFVFPFASILFVWFDTINIGFIILAIIQYPVYGLLIDLYSKRYKKTILFIIILHGVTAIAAYNAMPEWFK